MQVCYCSAYLCITMTEYKTNAILQREQSPTLSQEDGAQPAIVSLILGSDVDMSLKEQ